MVRKTLVKYGGNHYGRGLNSSRKKRQRGGDKQVAYVINLDKRPEKWERIQNDFKDTSLNLERFSAIENSNGHIGLGNSFKALIQKAKNENMESILILEDDCKPLHKFDERWKRTYEWLMNNKDKWEVFNGSAKHPNDEVEIHKFDNKNSLKTMSKGKYATMMLIKNDAYDKVLEWEWDKHWLFDFNFINNSDYFKNIFIDPPLALQYSGFSNTERIDKNYTNENSGKIKEAEQLGGNTSKAYVINLDKRTDRWEEIQNNFKSSSISLERISAVEDSRPHYGCGYSILKLVKKAKDENMETILIFEDDNQPSEGFDKRWQKIKLWLDSNMDKWEIFFGSPKVEGNIQLNLRYEFEDNINLLEASLALNTNWLYINKKAYDKILLWSKESIEKNSFWGAIDRYLGNTKYFSNLVIVPFLSVQAKGYSDIQKAYNSKNGETKAFTETFNKLLAAEKAKEVAYINSTGDIQTHYLYPIIKNIFPNKRIVYEEGRSSYDLLVKTTFDDTTNISQPFIFVSGERSDKTTLPPNDNKYCLGRFVTSLDKRLYNDSTYYLPYFLDVGPKIYDTSPLHREYTPDNELITIDHERKYLAAYVNKVSQPHRDDFFKELSKLDTTVHALGKSSKSYNVKLPDNWWDLPDVFKDYIFGFAMENGEDEGYITEKIMNVYRGGAIPIYWGTSKVKEIFNPESFIYVNDYKSYEECAKEIIAISKDKERLSKMQKAPIFLENMKIPYDKYYDSTSPQWVIDIANKIKSKLSTGGQVETINPITISTALIDSSKEIAYINFATRTETEYVYPIIKNIFPTKRIVFEDGRDSYDLLVKSTFDNTQVTNPFIYISGEPYDRTTMPDENNKYCLARFVATLDKRLYNDSTYYLPFFLDIGPKIYDTSPLHREYSPDSERKYLAAYINKQSQPHRDDFFKELSKLDTTVHALGNASKSYNVKLPDNWWDLPDVYKDYIFGFAMENTDEEGYISEKIMNVYRGGAIPIYWGTSKVKEIFNPESFIYVNDYKSYEECVKEIIAISKDKERLSKMQKAPIFLENMKIPYDKYYDTPSPQWLIDIANKIKSKLSTGGQVESIHPIAISTVKNEQLKRLTNSAKRQNISIDILGLELNTMDLGHNNVGTDEGKTRKFGMKLALPKEYVKNLPDDDILLFTDAWDVIYLDKLDSILEKYKKFNKSIIFGAEKTCWPDSDKESEFVDTKNSKFPYLNSGGYIGRVKDIRDLLNNYNDAERIDDQRFWIDMYLKNKDLIGLDTNAEIFLNTCATDKKYYTFNNNKFVFTETDTTPSIIHANSSDKSYLDLFIQSGGRRNKKTRKNKKYKAGSIQKVLINYTNQGMEEARKQIKETALGVGNFTKVIEYYPKDIDEEFKTKNKKILNSGRGGGYWLWKPYFILKTLNTMNENDILVYLDCDMHFISSIDTYINNMDGSIMVFQIEDKHLEKYYTKMDLFIELGCQDNKEITDTAQIFTSPSIWKKTQNTLDFVKLWLSYCENYHLISDEEPIKPNFPGFKDNRHDQSILSCLSKLNKDKYKIQIERCPLSYCNNTRKPILPRLVN